MLVSPKRKGATPLSHFTSRSIVAVGLRRNLGSTAASTFSLATLQDIGKSFVIKSEIETAAAHVGTVKSFQADMEAFVDDCEAGKFSIVMHAFRSDATTAAIWQSSKLQGLHLESLYVLSPDSVLTSRWEDVAHNCSGFADCQRVGLANAVVL